MLDATRYGRRGAVCTIDPLASSAGLAMLRAGGSAADAAIAASAVLAVTAPHMCGMGGDLLAVVHPGGTAGPQALVAAGAAGSGVSAQALRDEGHTTMPMRGDLRSVTVPGCVDGWLALHGRFGRLPLSDVLEPARDYAADGFPVTVLLARALPVVADVPAAAELFEGGAPGAGDLRRRTALARAISDIADGGRDAWYGGDFGAGLMAMGRGQFTADDLERDSARWEAPLSWDVWGARLHTTPAPSQGYLTLAHVAVLEAVGGLPEPEDPAWPHLLVECARVSGQDRPRVLHDGAAPEQLLDAERVASWAGQVHRDRAGSGSPPTGPGGTIFLAAVDENGCAVALSQSNASGFGVHLGVEAVGVLLHNRGIGFSLDPRSPAVLAPDRRPVHTLSPLLGTDASGAASLVAGTMGGDAQPQLLLQLLSRLHAGETPAGALAAARWAFASPGGGGFDIWAEGTGAATSMRVRLEGDVPPAWVEGMRTRGQALEVVPDGAFGHAHLVARVPHGGWAAASDPRAGGSAAVW